MSYAQIFISADITVAHNNVCRCSCPFFGALPPSGPPCEGLISDWGPCRSRVLISLVFTLSSTCHFSLSLVYTSAIHPSFIHSVFTPDSPTTSFTTFSSRPVAIDALIFPPDFSRCSLASFQYLVSVSFLSITKMASRSAVFKRALSGVHTESAHVSCRTPCCVVFAATCRSMPQCVTTCRTTEGIVHVALVKSAYDLKNGVIISLNKSYFCR